MKQLLPVRLRILSLGLLCTFPLSSAWAQGAIVQPRFERPVFEQPKFERRRQVESRFETPVFEKPSIEWAGRVAAQYEKPQFEVPTFEITRTPGPASSGSERASVVLSKGKRQFIFRRHTIPRFGVRTQYRIGTVYRLHRPLIQREF